MAKDTKLIGLLLVISLIINLYLVKTELDYRNWKKRTSEAFSALNINNSDFETELHKLFRGGRVKYYYIGTWASFCFPCIKEMPLLDSVISLNPGNITGYFVTDITPPENKYAGLKFRNFNFLYRQNNLVSAIHNKFNVGIKTYPLNLLVDTNFNVLFFTSKGMDRVNIKNLSTTVLNLEKIHLKNK